MAEKPIIFCTDMVCAILDGRKTQTRRVIKPQPIYAYPLEHGGQWFWTERDADDDMMGWWPSYEKGLKPHYQPGDILWVRETWMECKCSSKYHYKATYRQGLQDAAQGVLMPAT